MGTDQESVPGWVPGGGLDPIEPPPTPGPPVYWAPPVPKPPADAIPGWGAADRPDNPPAGWTQPTQPNQATPTPTVGWSAPAAAGSVPSWGTAFPVSDQGGAARSDKKLLAAIGIIVVLAFVASIAVVTIVLLIFVGGHLPAAVPPVATELSSPSPDISQPSGDTEQRYGQLVSAASLVAGDCFDPPQHATNSTIAAVTLLRCNTPHILEVVAVVALPDAPDAPFPGNNQIAQEAGIRCATAFTSYVGIPEEASIYTSEWYRATESGWDAGDHMVECLAMTPHGTPILGSVMNAYR